MTVYIDGYAIYQKSVDPATTEYAVTKTTGFYLLENSSITIFSPYSSVYFSVSYEIIS
jgi:hypothetical protein